MQRDMIDDIRKRMEKICSSSWYWEWKNKEFLKQVRKECPDVDERLARNAEFKGVYKGKRCFVLGNGPSLNDIDFSLLRDEFVFTVNRLTMHPDFEKLNANYHFITDLDSFGYGSRRKLLPGFIKHSLEQMRALREKGNPVFIVPVQAQHFIQKNKLDQELSVRYLLDGVGSFFEGHRSDDITKPLPWVNSVIAYAILWAAYMGFQEIYLLGCDQTILRDVMDAALGKQILHDHAYQGEEKISGDGYRMYVKNDGIVRYLEGEAKVQKTYAELYKWCRQKKIRLCNLSSVTLIDGIPRGNFEEVLSDGKL